jgi:hypothetical protein
MCPINMVGDPGIVISQMCIDCICLPLGLLISKGFLARHLFTTSMPSMKKIDVAPMSAIALVVAMVNAFKNSCLGFPNKERAAAASEGPSSIFSLGTLGERFDAAAATLSLSKVMENLGGSRNLSYAETK